MKRAFFMNCVEFFKPNEMIATIGELKLDRLARHLGNYFFEHAQKKLKFENFQGNSFRLPLQDLNEVAEIKAKDYKKIEKSIKSLQQTVSIRSADQNKYVSFVMFPEIGIDFENSEYFFELSTRTIAMLRRIDVFTKLDLLEMNPLVSKHALIIFEWLKRYEHAPQIPELSIEELRRITDTADKRTYDNYARIEAQILNVAVKEINEKTSYQASYEAIKERAKTRPKVTKLRWTFERKAEPEPEPEQSNVSNTTQDISIHVRYAELATLYVSDGFCESEADFYKATYIADLSLLRWFYDKKKHLQKAKNKLNKYLLADIEKGSKNGRWQSQIDVYKALLARLSAKDQAFMLEKQGQQGFYEQILILKEHLGDVTPVKDPEKWL